jgi:hypothetical protein
VVSNLHTLRHIVAIQGKGVMSVIKNVAIGGIKLIKIKIMLNQNQLKNNGIGRIVVDICKS